MDSKFCFKIKTGTLFRFRIMGPDETGLFDLNYNRETGIVTTKDNAIHEIGGNNTSYNNPIYRVNS